VNATADQWAVYQILTVDGTQRVYAGVCQTSALRRLCEQFHTVVNQVVTNAVPVAQLVANGLMFDGAVTVGAVLRAAYHWDQPTIWRDGWIPLGGPLTLEQGHFAVVATEAKELDAVAAFETAALKPLAAAAPTPFAAPVWVDSDVNQRLASRGLTRLSPYILKYSAEARITDFSEITAAALACPRARPAAMLSGLGRVQLFNLTKTELLTLVDELVAQTPPKVPPSSSPTSIERQFP
jgi:hypothetical protein